jgi:hypothetical protein
MSLRFSTVAIVALSAAAASAGCQLFDGGTPLADMVNKTLFMSGPSSVMLSADGECTFLSPGTVQATVNGHPMYVEPGRKGSGIYESECILPEFYLTDADIDLGATATIVISDSSQTLRVVIVGLPDRPPILEEPTAEPKTLHPGGTARVGFSIAGGEPKMPDANFVADGAAPNCVPSFLVSTIDGDAVKVELPRSCARARRSSGSVSRPLQLPASRAARTPSARTSLPTRSHGGTTPSRSRRDGG